MIIPIYAVLFLLCTLYAMVLAWWRRQAFTYAPDHTWVTVVLGDVFIIAAIVALFLAGQATVWSVIGTFPVAGAPIIVWQLLDTHSRYQALRKERLGGTHAWR